MESPLYVTSEIGKLKSVLVHCPGKELENLTPDYLPDLLFDDIPWLEKAQKEHDIFAETLKKQDIEVLYLDQLTAEAIADPSVRARFISEMLTNSKMGDRPYLTEALYAHLQSFDNLDCIHKIMSGIRKDELEVSHPGPKQLHELLDNSYPFYLDPMPNLYFTRDPAATIGKGLTINKMHFPARRRESLFVQYIIEHHPRFKDHYVPKWYTRDKKFSIEGGDELVLSNETVAIGISQRTSAEAIESVAEKLLGEGGFTRVIAIEIPKLRAFMHLDTVFTHVDHDKFSVHPAVIEEGRRKMNIFTLTKNHETNQIHVKRNSDLIETLAEALGKNTVSLIPCGDGDIIAAAREQWNDGSNTLAIAPGVVVTYDRNYVSIDLLKQHGIKVHETLSSELARGRGSARCMSQPLWREDI